MSHMKRLERAESSVRNYPDGEIGSRAKHMAILKLLVQKNEVLPLQNESLVHRITILKFNINCYVKAVKIPARLMYFPCSFDLLPLSNASDFPSIYAS